MSDLSVMMSDIQVKKIMTENRPLVSYGNMQQQWRTELYMDRSNVSERYGIAWLWLGIWELRDTRKSVERGSGAEEENERRC